MLLYFVLVSPDRAEQRQRHDQIQFIIRERRRAIREIGPARLGSVPTDEYDDLSLKVAKALLQNRDEETALSVLRDEVART